MRFKVFFKELKQGDKGPKVRKIAEMLRKHGSSIKATDVFTIGMTTAVRTFQRKNYLDITGTVNRETWKCLKRKPIKMEA